MVVYNVQDNSVNRTCVNKTVSGTSVRMGKFGDVQQQPSVITSRPELSNSATTIPYRPSCLTEQ